MAKEISMNISPQFVFGLDKILDFLVENNTYLAQYGLVKIKYDGTTNDTANGNIEVFTITRKREDI